MNRIRLAGSIAVQVIFWGGIVAVFLIWPAYMLMTRWDEVWLPILLVFSMITWTVAAVLTISGWAR